MDDLQYDIQGPMSSRSGDKSSLVGIGSALMTTGPGGTMTLASARSRAAENVPDPHQMELAAFETQFYQSNLEKERVHNTRHRYPKRGKKPVASDPLTGDNDDKTPRRIMGFSLGFEKIFATTSVELPVSAYTVFVELHGAHNGEAHNRCFNGLHTVFDLKKWIFETMLMPINSYDLSYAEPGKATLTDQLRLLTTQESLDTRTLAHVRAAHGTYKGVPGVHSVGDIGVTRLYVRLKCRTCGDLLTTLQTCRKYIAFGEKDIMPDTSWHVPNAGAGGKITGVKSEEDTRATSKRMTLGGNLNSNSSSYCPGVPGMDPTIEDCWHRPDQKKHCLFHTRGYDMFEAARTHGGHTEVARIYISCGNEPSKKLKAAETVSPARKKPVNISY